MFHIFWDFILKTPILYRSSWSRVSPENILHKDPKLSSKQNILVESSLVHEKPSNKISPNLQQNNNGKKLREKTRKFSAEVYSSSDEKDNMAPRQKLSVNEELLLSNLLLEKAFSPKRKKSSIMPSHQKNISSSAKTTEILTLQSSPDDNKLVLGEKVAKNEENETGSSSSSSSHAINANLKQPSLLEQKLAELPNLMRPLAGICKCKQ